MKECTEAFLIECTEKGVVPNAVWVDPGDRIVGIFYKEKFFDSSLVWKSLYNDVDLTSFYKLTSGGSTKYIRKFLEKATGTSVSIPTIGALIGKSTNAWRYEHLAVA